jgi:phosphoglycerol transferase MdoB-like AlkP superfamily enzyme
LRVIGFLRGLLGRRDWVYLLSLLVPFVIYNLTLKIASVLSQPFAPGFALTFELMWSDIFFNLGYVLLWIGLFAVIGEGILRRVAIFLFHAVTIFVVIITTCAYQYFKETGTTLDYGIIALWLPKFEEVVPILARGVPVSIWVLLVVALFYVTLGPRFVTRMIERRGGGRFASGASGISLLDSAGLFLLALGFGSLSLLISNNPLDTNTALARDPFVNVVLTGFEEATTEDDSNTGPPVEHPAADATLAETPQTQKRNVVLIHLESTRAESVTPYNKDLQTTPFLDELAKSSLLAERAYTTVPHTSKASVSVNCGIEPHLVQPVTEAEPGGVPVPCLASLLKEQGYSTAFFQSSTEDFENFQGLVRNFGYDDYYPLESMDTKGFKRTNYFGYEDDIMLKPSEEWLKGHKDEPFVAEYLMGTGHHDYQCLDTRYGNEDFSNDDMLNQYLNCLRLQDIFVKNLMDQYKQLGLYDNTIFVIYGDHGEGFGEHGRYQHDDVPWEEGLKVPLIIHAPGLLDNGERVKGLTNHTDILPTVVDLLGYEVENGEYPGYSLVRALPEDRTLMFSCFHEKACLASIKGDKKYIYHYDNQQEEYFDLSKDPSEKRNLAEDHSKEADERREELFKWRSNVNAAYRS